jgi:hypothetical protein
MNLKEIILNSNEYEDSNEFIHLVFAEKANGKFEPNSQAAIIKLSNEEMEMDLADISNSKCPGFDYFLELYIIEDFYTALDQLDRYKTDEEKVKRIILYAEKEG